MAGSGVSQKCVECGEMLSQPNILFFPFFCSLFFFFCHVFRKVVPRNLKWALSHKRFRTPDLNLLHIFTEELRLSFGSAG